MFRSFKSALVALAFLSAASAAEAQVDFTRYVAVGDSLTAGFMSGSLVQTGQVNSYPALLFRQATGQATGFEQPLVSQPGIPGVLRLTSLVPVIVAPTPGRGNPLNLNLQRPYNNLAVPGADARDVLARVTDGGGLHDLILRGLGTQVQQARALNPTFVSIWVGNNDALAAATSGIINDTTLTPLASFEADYRAIVAQLAQPGVELAIANIPDVATIPYVTTIPSVLVNPATNQPVVINGNLVPLLGPNGPLTAADRVLLPASAALAQGIGIPQAAGGTGQPLPDSLVLSAAEVATIRARVAAFNTVIRTVANERGAAFVDANAILQRAATTGLQVGGINY
ncbi:MAG TPA: SGNH/GDSL hydrolase family protein, partial [Thermoanaerobaculia bacterium]|nr:SGNH/GDSL hydrolase family protein [Thermoanaerobaculia bacterium]